MSKLEDNVNEILGIEKKENSVQVSDFEQPAPVPRKIDENKTILGRLSLKQIFTHMFDQSTINFRLHFDRLKVD